MRIYTSYFGNIRHLPATAVPISISRFTPPEFHSLREWGLDLAPSEQTLYDYRITGNVKPYLLDYAKILGKYKSNKSDLINTFKRICQQFGKEDIVLLCYEKPPKFCHRLILAKFLSDEHHMVHELPTFVN